MADKRERAGRIQRFSDELELLAAVQSIRFLSRGDSLKLYEDNQKALLNNPQWRESVTKRIRRPQ